MESIENNENKHRDRLFKYSMLEIYNFFNDQRKNNAQFRSLFLVW